MAIDLSHSRRKAGRIISVTVIAYTLAIGVAALHKANSSPRADDADVFANFIGVAPQVDDPIAKLYMKDNQFVKKGDLLLDIDERPYLYALQHAESERDALEGQITEQSKVIAAQNSGVAVSEAGARNAEVVFRSLYPKNELMEGMDGRLSTVQGLIEAYGDLYFHARSDRLIRDRSDPQVAYKSRTTEGRRHLIVQKTTTRGRRPCTKPNEDKATQELP